MKIEAGGMFHTRKPASDPARSASAEAMNHCGLATLDGFSAEERRAWEAWAPVLSMLPLARWSAAEREQMFAGYEELGRQVAIRCFRENPSIASSLKFLRRTPWAREKVESLYLFMLREQARAARSSG